MNDESNNAKGLDAYLIDHPHFLDSDEASISAIAWDNQCRSTWWK